MSRLLRPLEMLYRGVNRLRRALYRAGLLRQQRLPRPVISVGNIAMGGTGKTPAVIAICRHLENRGLKVAVLTRGYGRRDRATAGLVLTVDADKYGDEPSIIKRLTNADVIVGHNRYVNALSYLRIHTCDVFVLDDGFQHLRLSRDLDIVIDAPSRHYREGRGALDHADIVIPRRLRTVVPESLRGERVFAFAALADNEQFFESLRRAGLELAGTRGFSDHHRYTPADLDALRRSAGGAPLVTTEKDAVKIPDPSIIAVGAEFELAPEVLERVAAVAERRDRKKRRRRKNALIQRVEYLAYRFVARLVLSMSEEAVSRWGTRLGALARHLVRGRDRLAFTNLRATFPDRDPDDVRRTLDACWRHFGREMLRYLRMRNLSLQEVVARCTVVNRHILDDAIARGKGTLIITAHWGSWEVAGLALMSLVENVRSVARPLDNELLERDLQQLRAKTGAAVVDRRQAARALLRALDENAVVALLPDQAVLPREGVLVPFLGRPAWTTPAPAKMALRSGATLVFGFCRPEGAGYVLEVDSAIRPDEIPPEERDAVELTRRINDAISHRIRQRPELWLWMHDRWKGTGAPPGR